MGVNKPRSKELEYYYQHRDSINEKRRKQRKEFRKLNPPKCKRIYPDGYYGSSEYYKERYKKNKQAAVNRAIANEKLKMQSDPLFRFKKNTRRLVLKTFEEKGFTKRSRTQEILGCTFDFFKAYIEQRFLPGMGWHNRSEWHLDHIIPISIAKTEKDVIRLNHYSNFRPLWAFLNLSKGAKTNSQLNLMAA